MSKPLAKKREIAVTAIPDGMEQVAPDLYRVSPEGLLFVLPLAISEPVLLSLVRPIRGTDEAVALRTAA